LLKGNALVALGRVTEAIQVFTALTADYPGLPEPYNNLAVLYAQQNQLDKARAALKMALQTNRAYATAQTNLADVYARLAAQAYDKALQRDIVERQNGQTAPSINSIAPPQLALVQDLSSAPGMPVATSPVPASEPVVVASTAPVAKPVPPVVAPAVAKPVANPVTSLPAPSSKPVSATPAATKPAAPAEKPRDSNKDAEDQIEKAVRGWADAWSTKHVASYIGFYSRSFKPAGLSRSEWEKQRHERIEGVKKIEVKLSNIRVKLDGDRATVRFVQRYKSDRLDTSAGKTLILEKNGGRWLIVEERVG
jgi:ketosteroid isomerase-like protein